MALKGRVNRLARQAGDIATREREGVEATARWLQATQPGTSDDFTAVAVEIRRAVRTLDYPASVVNATLALFEGRTGPSVRGQLDRLGLDTKRFLGDLGRVMGVPADTMRARGVISDRR